MVFSSLTFLFLFLPIALILYYLCPPKLRNGVLVVISLCFYAWGGLKFLWIMLFSTVFDYVNGRLLEYFQKREKKGAQKAVLIVSVVGNLAILGTFKYAGGFLDLVMPIGISFYTFQTMSYTIDVYRRKVAAQHNIINFAAYVTMFPQLIAGPIVRYDTVAAQLTNRSITVDKFAAGIRRFILGLGKKVLIANLAGQLWEYASAQTAPTMLLAWLGMAAYTFQIYFDFSGYSDMAIGLGKMFGFDYLENFDHPYTEKSITGFWRKWHMSLSSWFKEYVYIPLGGSRKGTPRQLLNIMIVWALTGIWHGASINFGLWGIYFGLFLILEKTVFAKFEEKVPDWLKHIYMMLVVMFGWVLFAITDFGSLGQYMASLFGANGILDRAAVYQMLKYGLLLIICIIGSGRLPYLLAGKLEKRISPTAWMILENLVLAVILLLSVALIVGDSYNPFLYFRF